MWAMCGGEAAAWVAGVLAAPGTQGGWRLGQQEIYHSRRVWQPVLTNMLQYSCLENPLIEKPGRPQSTGSQRVGHDQRDPICIDTRLFFACDSSAPVRVEHEGGRAAWVVGTMVAPTVQGYGLPQPLEYWPYQSLFSNLWYLTIRRPLRLELALL